MRAAQRAREPCGRAHAGGEPDGAVLTWLGIRGFNPALRRAPARLRVCRRRGRRSRPTRRPSCAGPWNLDEQIKEIEAAPESAWPGRMRRITPWSACWPRSTTETADILVTEVLSYIPNRRALARSGLPARRTRAAETAWGAGTGRSPGARVHDPWPGSLPGGQLSSRAGITSAPQAGAAICARP